VNSDAFAARLDYSSLNALLRASGHPALQYFRDGAGGDAARQALDVEANRDLEVPVEEGMPGMRPEETQPEEKTAEATLADPTLKTNLELDGCDGDPARSEVLPEK
jgi:hypothetical protein